MSQNIQQTVQDIGVKPPVKRKLSITASVVCVVSVKLLLTSSNSNEAFKRSRIGGSNLPNVATP